MNHSDNEDIDALLREQFEGAVPDDGFADRLMQQVPRRRRRAAWPVLVGIVAGIGSCWLSLLPTSLMRVGWQHWISGERSSSAIIVIAAVAGMSLLACWWTAMESEGP